MPNLGLSVGAGIALWKAFGLTGEEKVQAKNFLNKFTENIEVKEEDKINKTTPISGSGPAHFFFLADSMRKAGIKIGLTKEESRKLVEKTLFASALLAKDGNYSALIKKVASKGGVTERALDVFQKEKLEDTGLRAGRAAYKKANELSK